MPALVGLLHSDLPRPVVTAAATVGFSSRHFAYLKGQHPALPGAHGRKQLAWEGEKEFPSFLALSQAPECG